MSHIVAMFATYLCTPAAGACDLVFNEGEPSSDRMNGAWYACREVDYDESIGASALPEHVPLAAPPKS